MLIFADLALFHEGCRSQILWRDQHYISHLSRARSQGQHLHVLFLDPASSQYSEIRQVVLGSSANTLLAEDHICPGGINGIDLSFDDLLFALFERIEILGFGYGDFGIRVQLLQLQGAFQQQNLGLNNTFRHLG